MARRIPYYDVFEPYAYIGYLVEVYWNLHRECFSVRTKGRVVAHAARLKLTNVTFKVSEAGRARVLREQRKNVHAFIVGRLGVFTGEHFTDEDSGQRWIISYDPYKSCHFQARSLEGTRMPIRAVARVVLDSKTSPGAVALRPVVLGHGIFPISQENFTTVGYPLDERHCREVVRELRANLIVSMARGTVPRPVSKARLANWTTYYVELLAETSWARPVIRVYDTSYKERVYSVDLKCLFLEIKHELTEEILTQYLLELVRSIRKQWKATNV
jgi:hypothetical protein